MIVLYLADFDSRLLTLTSRWGARAEAGIWSLNTILEKDSSTSSNYISYYMSTLRVTADDEVGVWAPLVVRNDLCMTIGRTFFDRLAVGSASDVKKLYVFVVTALSARADSIDEFCLSSRRLLVVA